MNKNITTSLIGALGIVSALVSLFWSDHHVFSARYFNGLILLSCWVIIFYIFKYSELKEENRKLKEENSLLIIKPYEIPFALEVMEDKTILLIRNSRIFSNQTFVGIYYKERDYEHLVFIGEIINYQTNGMFQIEIKRQMPTNKIKLCKDNLHEVLVKPSFPVQFLEHLK